MQVPPGDAASSAVISPKGTHSYNKSLQPDPYLERGMLKVLSSSSSVLRVPAEKSHLVWKADALLRRRDTKFGFGTEYYHHSRYLSLSLPRQAF